MSITAHLLDTYEGSCKKAHAFSDPEVAEYYTKLYNEAKYEGRDHFDPQFEWTPQEEKALVRKTEILATGWAFIMFVALDIDRSNISNALSSSFLGDLGLTTNDYNLGATLNLLSFLAAEVPSQLISKKLGPDVWIPVQMCLWSVVAISQSFISGKKGFFVCRVVLGALEGGFIPDVILWLSYFYTGSELAVRIGYFYVANPLTDGLSAIIAFLIFHLDGLWGWEGWRYLFFIEGFITLAIGVASFTMMTASAVETKSWWRPDGWYTKREEKIMVNRILRDDPSKGGMHNREALSLRCIWDALKDYNMWPIVLTRFFNDLTPAPLNLYLTIIIRSMGFSTLLTNLLLIPPAIGSILTNIASVHLSARYREHGIFMIITAAWVALGVVVMKFWDGFLTNSAMSYLLLVVTLSYPFAAPLTVSWASANSNSVSGRTISASTVNVASQCAGIVGANIFRADDAPLYSRGLTECLYFGIMAVAVSSFSRLYFNYANSVREIKWSQMDSDERIEYMRSTQDTGSHRLDFRFST